MDAGRLHQLDATVASTLLITNIGAPSWGLVFGFAAPWLPERRDHALPGA